MTESRHEQALRHVLRGRQIVAQQEQLVADLHWRCEDAAAAEQLLESFRISLEIFEADLAAIEAQVVTSGAAPNRG